MITLPKLEAAMFRNAAIETLEKIGEDVLIAFEKSYQIIVWNDEVRLKISGRKIRKRLTGNN